MKELTLLLALGLFWQFMACEGTLFALLLKRKGLLPFCRMRDSLTFLLFFFILRRGDF
jgi:hypothetical protein